ncbi:hypothetical protein F5Y04DRAFT_250963 [Hypomontagnella monticulosa]|nr:hypothetical protein F5Y04DRAFT_250963 [Hypomontagnella monticulosa]
MDISPIKKLATKKRGRKPKSIDNHQTRRIEPYKNTLPQHSNKKKIEVLVWITQIRIPLPQSIARPGYARPTVTPPDDGLPPVEPGYRRPTYAEAAEFFKIPRSTIGRWWRRRDDILQGHYGTYKSSRPEKPQLKTCGIVSHA